MNLLESYIRELREIRSSGSAVKETSYYPALANLLNRAGSAFKRASSLTAFLVASARRRS